VHFVGLRPSLISALDECGWSTPHPDGFTREKDPVTLIKRSASDIRVNKPTGNTKH
jgi:hypothetical protein